MNLIRIALQTSILTSVVLTGLIINGDAARSQQRACVITDDGATVCGKPTTVKKEAKRPVQSSGYRKEVANIVFLLKGCRKLDTSLKCEMLISNKGAERSVSLFAKDSAIVDFMGKSHPGSTVDIGGQSDAVTSTVISPGIDYVATINFENISDQITKVPLLNIYQITKGQPATTTQFRNISFAN